MIEYKVKVIWTVFFKRDGEELAMHQFTREITLPFVPFPQMALLFARDPEPIVDAFYQIELVEWDVQAKAFEVCLADETYTLSTDESIDIADFIADGWTLFVPEKSDEQSDKAPL